ncbi:MAG: adenylate cyclase, partial [Myxococcota bacterium]
ERAMEKVAAGSLDGHTPIQGLDTMGGLTSHFNAMVEGLREREQIRQIFGRYVAKQVADEILGGRIELGGELRTATVLFTDIRGFTTISETMAPTEVIDFLNRYFEHMVSCVIQNDGVLDKFIGDAIMALFGVPVTRSPELDARAAVQCAIEMRQALIVLNTERQSEGLPAIDIGIGIHTGPLVVGNIGTRDRTEYTVIGDVVNLASRLEGLTKSLGKPVLISADTAALLGDMDLTELGTYEVRGRSEPVRLFTIAEDTATPLESQETPASQQPAE